MFRDGIKKKKGQQQQQQREQQLNHLTNKESIKFKHKGSYFRNGQWS